jgi:hypothetical protein|tara:strand:+ start:315 stop:2735 length:2421 start_codon:yes stop_codon:yes gene_type:complete
MAESVINNYFPSQVVSDSEKNSTEYGLKIAKAIEHEWFFTDRGSNKYRTNQNQFHKLRLYARGEQPIQKYKDELSINGDLSYLNLDWKPVPIIPKFVDIVVNGIAERTFDIKAYSQDPFGVSKRTDYLYSMQEDMMGKDLGARAKQSFGIDIMNNDPSTLPETKEELDLHMQLSYKQAVEIANEQAINVLLDGNKYELIKKRYFYDLAVLGIGAVKTGFNTSQGVVVDYVDPVDLVYSYTESPYFDDIYYVGEVKSIPVNELIKQFPDITDSEIESMMKNKGQQKNNYNQTGNSTEDDNNKVQVLYFNYKTYNSNVYKIKKTGTGAMKAIEKSDSFNPPPAEDFERLSSKIEVLYEGAKVLGSEKLLKWGLAENMIRPKSDYSKVQMNYSIVAPRMYKGQIESLVRRITGFADMIQLTHLKLQQVLSRVVPDGIYLDADGLAEIDLGNGTNYNPQEALNMFFQTGSIIGRSFTSEGDQNPGKVPIQEIQSGSGGQKMQSLIQTYNYYMQMIRDTTGLNEARDGSTPDKNALVGVQKLAAANSNTATRHILQSGLFLTQSVCEALSLRISDVLEYSPTREAFIQKIGAHNVATLEEMSELHLYDFGIFLELMPDEEEKAMLENNIQMALQQKNIELEDAIDLREIKNVKLANQLLKIRRKKKQDKDQAIQERNMKLQSQTNQQAAQAAAQAEMQKNQAASQLQIQLEQIKSQLESKKMQEEVMLKKQLLDHEHQQAMELKQMEMQSVKGKDTMKEDRKDERTKIQATQQSEMIDQRNAGKAPKNFESSSDNNTGEQEGFDMSMFGTS